MNEEVKVLNVTATPVNVAPEQNVQQCMDETVQIMNDTLNQFSDEVVETVEESKARNFLNDFKSYVQSAEFKDDVNQVAKKYGVPPKKVAQNFFEKALGTVGDILGIAISVVCNAGRVVVNVASTIAHSIVNLIQSIFNGIASIVTLNKTCIAN